MAVKNYPGSFPMKVDEPPSFSESVASFLRPNRHVWTSVMSVGSAIGFFILMLAFNRSRLSLPYANELYWVGIFTLYVPVFMRIVFGSPTRREMLTIITLLGMLLYLTKIIYSPTLLRFVDEQQQWRSAYNAFHANALFENNPILLISPYYPGLQNSAIAIASTTGVSLDVAAMILIGGLRLMLMFSLWTFFEEVTGNKQITGLACLLYMTNPGFLMFTSYFVYQSLALPMVILGITALVRWCSNIAPPQYRFGLMFVVVISIMVVIITHHVSSYLMVLYFLLFGLVFFLVRQIPGTRVERALRTIGQVFFGWKRDDDLEIDRNNHWDIYTWLTGLTLIAIVIWVVYIAVLTIDYLGPQFEGVYDEFTAFLTRERERDPYRAPELPRTELILGFAAIGMTVSGVLFGIWQALKRYKLRSHMVGLIMIGGGFYIFLMLRFVSARGGEILSRTWAFTFIALSIFLALTILALYNVKFKPLQWLLCPATVVLFCVYVAGNIASGWPPYWARLPGPYIAGGFDRAVDPASLESVDWVRNHIPPNRVFLADFVLHHLLGGYAEQAPRMGGEEIFTASQLGGYQRSLFAQNNIDYLAVDLRVSEAVSPVGFYYAPWEIGQYPTDEPLDINKLRKFEDVFEFDRLYDNGDIIIYDVQEYSDLSASS